MIDIAVKNFKKLKYSSNDIDIIPENLPPRPWYLGGEWYQYGFGPSIDMINFCKATGVKMTYDICHAQLWCNLEKITLHGLQKYGAGICITDLECIKRYVI